MKRLAILPARSGSKRIPNKNIKKFFGKPMISHILNVADSTCLFHKIHVSTDSKHIRKIVSELGFPPDFSRPENLAGDQIALMPVLKFVVNEYKRIGYDFDQIWSILPCSPLISAEDLFAAEKLFLNSGKRTPILSISEYPAPIEWAFDMDPSLNLKPVNPGKFAVNSQDLASRYYDTGNFAVFPTELIEESNTSGIDEGFLGYILPRNKAIDIDTNEDWDFAESLFKLNRLSKN